MKRLSISVAVVVLATLAAVGAPGAARADRAAASSLASLASLDRTAVRRAVLDGRLLIETPIAAVDAPGPVRSDETRIDVQAGAERLELRIADLYALAPAVSGTASAFSEAVRVLVAAWDSPIPAYRVEEIVLASGLPAIEITPVDPKPSPTSSFLRAMYVQHPDGTVQFLEARANAAAWAAGSREADRIAASVFHSAAPGPRRLFPLPTTYRLSTPHAGVTVFAEVPASLVGAVQRESSRVVHRFLPVAPLGDSTATLTITFARNGSYLHERLGRDTRPKFRETTVLGQKALWHSWGKKQPSGTIQDHLEALVTLGDNENPLVAHVVILHDDAEEAESLRAFVESLRVERRPR